MTPAPSTLANTRITALAADRTIHRAFHWLHLYEQQLQRWHSEFLAIPAPPFGEAARASWFLSRFAGLGLHNPHIDREGNTLAELPSDPCSLIPGSPASLLAGVVSPVPSRPIILLSAHLDTIFPAGTECTPRVDEHGKLLCPGATDNGAGLTALLAIAAALRYANFTPATTILFAANVGEEGEGDLRGMRHLFSRSPYAHRIQTAIALEGCGTGTLVDRALGSRRLRVEITGPGGHSWADAGRPSPINALAAAIAALTQLALPSNPRTTLNCGTISGGTSINSIPSSATADFDLRSTSTEELESLETLVLSTVSKCVKAEARRGRARDALRLQIRRIGDRTAGSLPSDSSLAISLRAVDRHLNIRTESRIGSTDANLPLSLGIPALAIGAGGTGGGIHTTEEWYSPTNRELALRRILLLLLDTCSQHATDTATLSEAAR
ncbi:MAG TPA: M20/M25/M40 family metallo-hydrolase [Acidobacteriaceae bacterium]|nr:M20/M25/M40 family metallo-hydrolase [Acidobacteriaceae bacterium]